MYRYDGAAAGPLPRALAAVAREHRLRRPRDRRGGVQLYDTLLRNLGVTRYELQLNSIGDRKCRPAYIERLNGVARRARGRARRGRAAEAPDEPAARVRRQERARAGRARRTRRRSASRSATSARSTSRAVRALARRVRRRVHARSDARPRARLLHAHDVRVHGPDDERQASTICGGGRYDYLIEEIGGPPTPGIGFGAGIERLVLSLELGRRPAERPAARRLLRRRRGRRARPTRSPLLAELRARGLCARHGLRGPLVEGPAHAGAAARRTTDRDLHGGRRRSARRGGEQDRRARRCVARSPDERVARHRLRRARARTTPVSAVTVAGWADTPTRPRRARLHRPARRDRQSSSSSSTRSARPRRRRLRTRSATSSSSGDAARSCAGAGAREPEHADRRDRAAGRRARDRLAVRAAAVPARRGERRRSVRSATAGSTCGAKLQRNIRLRARMVRSIRRGDGARRASSTSRRRSSGSRRPRARATSSCPSRLQPGRSTRCRSRRRSPSSCS